MPVCHPSAPVSPCLYVDHCICHTLSVFLPLCLTICLYLSAPVCLPVCLCCSVSGCICYTLPACLPMYDRQLYAAAPCSSFAVVIYFETMNLKINQKMVFKICRMFFAQMFIWNMELYEKVSKRVIFKEEWSFFWGNCIITILLSLFNFAKTLLCSACAWHPPMSLQCRLVKSLRKCPST